jgi:hypothetical protein
LNKQNDEVIPIEKQSTKLTSFDNIFQAIDENSMDLAPPVSSLKDRKKRVQATPDDKTIRVSARIKNKRFRLT